MCCWRQVADEFYERNLMKLIEEDFIGRNKAKVFKKENTWWCQWKLLMSRLCCISGCLDQKNLTFTHIRDGMPLKKIVKCCLLEAMEYQKRRVSETSPLNIYQEIKRSLYQFGKAGEDVY